MNHAITSFIHIHLSHYITSLLPLLSRPFVDILLEKNKQKIVPQLVFIKKYSQIVQQDAL